VARRTNEFFQITRKDAINQIENFQDQTFNNDNNNGGPNNDALRFHRRLNVGVIIGISAIFTAHIMGLDPHHYDYMSFKDICTEVGQVNYQ
jgi:hypothetical protein